MELLLFVAFLFCLLLALMLGRTASSARARQGSIVGQSDRRGTTGAVFFFVGLVLPPIALAAFAALLIADGLAWISAAQASLRQRRGKPPVKLGVDFGLGADWMLEASRSVPYRASAGPVLGALGSPRDGARAIAGNMGWLLLAAMGTTVWLGFWSFGVTFPCRHRPLIGAAKTALSTARSATAIWLQDHRDGRCPTVEQLKADRVLDTGFNTKDAWGNRIELLCEDNDIVARTAGPDRKLGTDDDIRVPPP